MASVYSEHCRYWSVECCWLLVSPQFWYNWIKFIKNHCALLFLFTLFSETLFLILQPETFSFCRQQSVSSEAVEAVAAVSWESPRAWQQNICFVLFLGEAGGCQCCRPVGSAGCHLHPVQETITDSCQTSIPFLLPFILPLTLFWPADTDLTPATMPARLQLIHKASRCGYCS